MSSGINWDGGGIPDAAHLRTLPDGTIISWLRVPGDRTSSEAVAFVRREVSNGSGFPQVDVWISPGGWDPQTIESAGCRFRHTWCGSASSTPSTTWALSCRC